MLRIDWLQGESKGYSDLLPDWILDASSGAVLVHDVRGPKGGRHRAKCQIARTGASLDLDYEAFADFNDRHGIYLGVIRITIAPSGAAPGVRWRSPGDNAFVDEEAKVTFERGLDLASQDIADLASRGKTERSRLIDARLGQGAFRAELDQRWRGCCALTGIAIDAVLRASHIKPWSACRDAERLDPRNGLLLAAHADALFDRYLISFLPDGTLCWSPRAPAAQRTAFAFPKALSGPLDKQERAFMAEHLKIFLA